MLLKTKGCEAVIAIDKCLSVTPIVKVHMLENVYEMLCESKIMYGIEMWGLSETWKELDNFHSRMWKKLMGILNCTASGCGEMELGRESKRGKCIGQTVIYWY